MPGDDEYEGLSTNEGNEDDENNADKEDTDPLVGDGEAKQNDLKDDDSHYEWREKVEDALRKWIDTEGCCRDVADVYFSNPPGRKGMFDPLVL
jgi:hypothetical protein